MAVLTSLPPEILSLICEPCNTSTLKSLRITHSRLCLAAEKWLFQELLLFMHRKSLRFAKNIAEHHRLAGHVQSLWIHGDHPQEVDFKDFEQKWHNECVGERFASLHHSEEMVRQREDIAQARQSLPSKEFWKRHRAHQRMFQEKLEAIPLPQMPHSELQEFYEQHQRLAREGVSIESGSSIRETLVLLFQACPIMATIEFSLGQKGSFYDKGWSQRFSRAIYNKEFRTGLLEPSDHSNESQCGLHIMEQVVLAAADSAFAPVSMKIGSAANFLDNLSASETRLPLVARNLQRLEWQLPDKWGNDASELLNTAESFNTGCLSAFIKHAVNLRVLDLAFSHSCNEGLELLPRLSGLVGSTTWPMLTSFKILMVNTTASELSAFLLRHSSSLQRVFLEDIFLEAGRWSDCFDRLAGRLPKLLIFEPKGMLADRVMNPWRAFVSAENEDNYRDVLTEYLLSGAGSFPNPPMDDSIAEFCAKHSPWVNI